MNTQLRLIENSGTWRLDDHTRAVGRAGVAQARAALQDATRRTVAPETDSAASGRAGRSAGKAA
jgi:hypothetical protein